MIELTDRAREVLLRAATSARRFDPDARIRLARDGADVRPGFAHGPEAGDGTLEVEGVQVFVEEGLAGVLDVAEPHDRLVLRPGGDG